MILQKIKYIFWHVLLILVLSIYYVILYIFELLMSLLHSFLMYFVNIGRTEKSNVQNLHRTNKGIK